MQETGDNPIHNNHIHIYELIYKYLSLLLIINVLFFSCNSNADNPKKSTQNHKSVVNHTSKESKNKVKQACIVSEYTGGLPFGSKCLMNIKYPYGWQYEDYNDKNQTSQDLIDQENISESIDYFNKLKNQTIKHTWEEINKTDVINLKYKFFLVDTVPYSIDSLKYRLPNFGPYQCFYAQESLPYPDPTSSKDYKFDGVKPKRGFFDQIGNLIFYDSVKHNIIILNIYFKIDSEWAGNWRFFYIDTNQTIHIYNYESGELDGYFDKECTIKVLNNGEIKVNYIK